MARPRQGGISLWAGLHAFDAAQQRRRWLALPVAVIKTFGEHNGGQLAGLIAYFGFFSLFPLLLVLVTLLGIVLHGDPSLQSKIIDSSLATFPIIGPQIHRNIHSLNGGFVPLLIGAAGALWAGLAVTNATRTAQDRIWGVPSHERSSFIDSRVHGLALIGALGAVTVTTTVLDGFVVDGHSAFATLAALAISLVLDFGLFVAVFVLLTSYPATIREILPGAVFATVAWELLQHVGGYLVVHQLKHLSDTYGLFAVVLGTLAWLHLGATSTLYAVTLNAVRAQRLWPRPLFGPPEPSAELPGADPSLEPPVLEGRA